MDLTIPLPVGGGGGAAWEPGLLAPAPPSAPVLGPPLGSSGSPRSLPRGGVLGFPKPQIKAKLQEAPGALLTGHMWPALGPSHCPAPASGEQAAWGSGLAGVQVPALGPGPPRKQVPCLGAPPIVGAW